MTTPRKIAQKDEKFMALAFFVADVMSPSPKEQSGAVIVSETTEEVLAVGYNTPPKTIQTYDANYGKAVSNYTLSASDKALSNSRGRNISGSTIYLTHKPSKESVLRLLEEGVKTVMYFFGKDEEDLEAIAKLTTGQTSLWIRTFTGNLNFLRDRMAVWQKLGVFD
jgi:deoxycytidylate deaminase